LLLETTSVFFLNALRSATAQIVPRQKETKTQVSNQTRHNEELTGTVRSMAKLCQQSAIHIIIRYPGQIQPRSAATASSHRQFRLDNVIIFNISFSGYSSAAAISRFEQITQDAQDARINRKWR
jgi:hypothetical protein